jgi:hypothetical protein
MQKVYSIKELEHPLECYMMISEINFMTEAACFIDQFPHSLPHRDQAELRPCGHYACPPHTITYYGTGDDDELVGDYCLVCYARKFPQHCPDRLLLQAALQR